MLGNSPGDIGFEKAPFKLSTEMIELMEGIDSELFGYYKILLFQGLQAVQKRSDDLVNLVEMMKSGTNYACLVNPEKALRKIRKRIHFGTTESELMEVVDNIVGRSNGNWRTEKYDYFQYKSNGICY
jgi:phosphatidylinositol 4-kinase